LAIDEFAGISFWSWIDASSCFQQLHEMDYACKIEASGDERFTFIQRYVASAGAIVINPASDGFATTN
jgi:hypothetical protein